MQDTVNLLQLKKGKCSKKSFTFLELLSLFPGEATRVIILTCTGMILLRPDFVGGQDLCGEVVFPRHCSNISFLVLVLLCVVINRESSHARKQRNQSII